MWKFKDTKRLVIHITPCRGETEGRVLSPLKKKQSEKWLFSLRNQRILASLPPGQVVPLARIYHEFRLRRTATIDMAVLSAVLRCPPLRRTVRVRKPTPCGCQVTRPSSSRSLRSAQSRKRVPSFFALAPLRSVPQAGSQFRGLATAIHNISGLDEKEMQLDMRTWTPDVLFTTAAGTATTCNLTPRAKCKPCPRKPLLSNFSRKNRS
jgi:hypothetical protein